ncbi:MAG: bifunctional UDP-N-acetylglucosamine diphosphorylase/glucosamine-1-phosphate N-acetyltransferase GlmU [Bacilli bacterium]|nr:bifunctional UDP-N-acetylglucosamine diphosphorylase/glucosamine-1-phosphate N-acetyltransferase GlmU [Bacilli bacterium]
MNHYAIVLAAGKGTRMRSARKDLSKMLFPVLGRPMVQWVLESLSSLELDGIATVVGHGGDGVFQIAHLYGPVVWQKEQKGTGDAVLSSSEMLEKEEGVTLVCCGDMPLITDKTLSALLSSHQTNHNVVTILTANVEDPHGFGRIIKNGNQVLGLVEESSCTPEQSAIHEINARVYAFDNRELFAALRKLTPSKGGEYHLTDAIRLILSQGGRVGAFLVSDPMEVLGINDRYQLSVAAKKARERINRRWMEQGVSFEDPDTAYIGPDVTLSRDVVIKPNVHVFGRSVLGEGNMVGPDTYLENVMIGANNVIECSHITDTIVEDDTVLGPYLRCRDGVRIRSGAHIGNFNELKATDFGEGALCAHLSYLGDASIGGKVNVGAGVIIANFDGTEKHRSSVEEGAMVGSNSVLVSPVNVGKDAFVAAGSVVTEDVPSGDLAIARGRQTNKPGQGKKKLKR